MLLDIFVNLGLRFFFLLLLVCMLVQISSGLLYSLIAKQTEHLGSCVAWGFISLTSSTLTLFRHHHDWVYG